MTWRLEDWRTRSAAEIAALLDAEARTWSAELSWDVTTSWRAIEPARRSGQLPGLLATDGDGRVGGWTCFLLHRHTLQVAMLVAGSAEATDALVDGILRAPETARAGTLSVCVRDGAPGLRDALTARGFAATAYRYLQRPTGAAGPGEPMCRPWEIDDAGGVARLCARAYADATEVRAFAPHGTPDEWHEYVATLVTGPGCGRFLPTASFTVPGRHARRPEAAIITTDLGPGTAHIAQVVVDPDARGQGWGRGLVLSAAAASATAGFRDLTLLVAEDNRRAGALYEDLGFADRASFLVAIRRQPRRLRSVALATGGASTRR